MARSLNRAELIGNLTRDPELRYTPQGTAVCTFSVATNRSWVTDSGEKREEVDFHKVVAWNKLAELCSQLLTKGRKVYVEGRIANRSWTGQDGTQKTTTEIVINDMLILDSRRDHGEKEEEPVKPSVTAESEAEEAKPAKKSTKSPNEDEKPEVKNEEDINPDDIPF
ncbi:MAG: single-stranded DNA-binding protein [Candidatus Levybacteria bacterium CG_4_10_14_0_2_um_filter_36_16]|nr:MAG: hypothetical protein AUK12_04275 [Candidatus Levybacteria bacterium CG2_30_37_29]PIR79517.1 MAG: single-stranded DNA-binding protein [Candidatus Levybacteria bacterium CG10_big_fil_rev_8_21_14_0_10_36_30]PIZ97957.1 MAG: single-stranded DNA-binding protein [Candidatus Levybacteria bacterium CG_4_10_14_0_2_um_filter_36_16]